MLRKALLLVAALLCAATTGLSSWAYLKDFGSPPDQLLDKLVDRLDAESIDVRRLWTGLIPPEDLRPQLARLTNYPVARTAFLSESWMTEFETGLAQYGALVALPRPDDFAALPSARPSPVEFVKMWNAADSSKRVFVCFTKQDVAFAEIVRRTLEADGYSPISAPRRPIPTSTFRLSARCSGRAGTIWSLIRPLQGLALE